MPRFVSRRAFLSGAEWPSVRRLTRTLRAKWSKSPAESSFAWKEMEMTFCFVGSVRGSSGQVVSYRWGDVNRGAEMENFSGERGENWLKRSWRAASCFVSDMSPIVSLLVWVCVP